jgi:hypothetical protein
VRPRARRAWLQQHPQALQRQAAARRLALLLGRALQLGLLVEHAQWSIDTENDPSSATAAARFGAAPFMLPEIDPAESRALIR